MTAKIIIAALAGGGLGFAIGSMGKCSTGACPLTGNPYVAAAFGAAIGVLLASNATRVQSETQHSEHVVFADEATFEETVSAGRSLVAFSASWCGACQRMAPVFAKLAEEYRGRVRFVKVDADASPNLAARFGVEALPTLIRFKDGQAEGEPIEGYGGEAHLRQLVEDMLKPEA